MTACFFLFFPPWSTLFTRAPRRIIVASTSLSLASGLGFIQFRVLYSSEPSFGDYASLFGCFGGDQPFQAYRPDPVLALTPE